MWLYFKVDQICLYISPLVLDILHQTCKHIFWGELQGLNPLSNHYNYTNYCRCYYFCPNPNITNQFRLCFFFGYRSWRQTFCISSILT